MATDLVLPEIAAKGLVPSHDLSLVRQLRSSWNVRLRTSWMGSRNQLLTSLELEPGQSVAQLQGALNELEEANLRRATATQIAKGLAVLTAVCAKPADFDDAKVVLWSERLKMVLQEYPDDIAMAAVSEWPKTETGKWWPTENEIRSECNSLMALRRNLAHALAETIRQQRFVESINESADPINDGFSADPEGETLAYVNAMHNAHPNKAAAYLTGARYKGRTIGIRYPLAAMALEDAAPGLLASYGVRIVSPAAFTVDGVAQWPDSSEAAFLP